MILLSKTTYSNVLVGWILIHKGTLVVFFKRLCFSDQEITVNRMVDPMQWKKFNFAIPLMQKAAALVVFKRIQFSQTASTP